MFEPPFPVIERDESTNRLKTPAWESFIHRMAPDRVNLLCPAGIGDVYWVLCKLKNLDPVIWIPEGEEHRAGALCELLDVDYSYLPGLTTDYVWSTQGSPEIGGAGVYVVQPNRHLESGKSISQWYPDERLEYPAVMSSFKPRIEGEYVVGFCGSSNYMNGQLSPEAWGSVFNRISMTVAPVVMVGAGQDVSYGRQVDSQCMDNLPAFWNRPLSEVVALILGAKAVVGVASGLTILSISHCIPTLIAYPRHLSKMPGTWERFDCRYRHCFVDQVCRAVANGWMEGLV